MCYTHMVLIFLSQWKAGKFAASLRRFLFREHLGLLKGDDYKDHDNVNKNCYPAPFPQEHKICTCTETDSIVEDPVAPEFYEKVWAATAKKNTEIYRDVFHCVPDDTGRHHCSCLHKQCFGIAGI